MYDCSIGKVLTNCASGKEDECNDVTNLFKWERWWYRRSQLMVEVNLQPTNLSDFSFEGLYLIG
jgi:hypothetical protein